MQARKSPALNTPIWIIEIVGQIRIGERPRHHGQACRDHREKRLAPIPGLAVETEDECQQVDRQWRDPEQRHRGDVLRDMVGDAEQQQRAGCRQRAPQHLAGKRRRPLTGIAARKRRRFRAGMRDHLECRAMPQARPARRCAQSDEERVTRGPAKRLRACRRPGLEQERVADKGQHRREIRQREQAIGTGAGPGPGKPRLDERARCRQQEVRKTDRCREHAQDQPRRVLGACRLPVERGNDRQNHEGHDEQRRVQAHHGAWRQPMHDDVAIGVTRQQRRLEEDETRGPHGRRAAEPWQDLLRHDRLHEKQQERADENGGGVDEHRGPAKARGPRRMRERRGSRILPDGAGFHGCRAMSGVRTLELPDPRIPCQRIRIGIRRRCSMTPTPLSSSAAWRSRWPRAIAQTSRVPRMPAGAVSRRIGDGSGSSWLPARRRACSPPCARRAPSPRCSASRRRSARSS